MVNVLFIIPFIGTQPERDRTNGFCRNVFSCFLMMNDELKLLNVLIPYVPTSILGKRLKKFANICISLLSRKTD